MRYFILINGIRTKPDSIDSWTDRAEEWIEENNVGTAYRYEYYDMALLAPFRRSRRIKDICTLIERASVKGHTVSVIAHSNGCWLACGVAEELTRRGWPQLETLSLIAGACKSNFEKNKLNDALRNGNVKKVVVMCSANDKALKAARFSCGLYGDLGLVGAHSVEPTKAHQVKVIRDDSMNHGDWFSKQFQRTMLEAVK